MRTCLRRPPRSRAVAVLAAAVLLGGCATYGIDDPGIGERREGPPATIAADPRVSAGLPLTVAIRKVGDREVGVAYSRVTVRPGRHRLLVDCTMNATRLTTRHELEVDVEPGGRYRLVGEEAPGNRRCGGVRLEPQ